MNILQTLLENLLSRIGLSLIEKLISFITNFFDGLMT